MDDLVYVQVGKPAKGYEGSRLRKVRSHEPAYPEPLIFQLTIEDALRFSLPRVLGVHPTTGKEISANMGRFGPYVVHNGDFRSIKAPDDVYTIALPRALEMLAQEKKPRGFRKKKETPST